MSKFRTGDIVICKKGVYSAYTGRPYKITNVDEASEKISILGSDYWYPAQYFEPYQPIDKSKALKWLKMLRDGDMLKTNSQLQELSQLVKEIEGDAKVQGT